LASEEKNYPYKYKKITKKQITQWLSMASNQKFNIFHDKNEIIYLLCKELLKKSEE
jgi:hypothetical protein